MLPVHKQSINIHKTVRQEIYEQLLQEFNVAEVQVKSLPFFAVKERAALKDKQAGLKEAMRLIQEGMDA